MVWPGDWTMKSVGPCPTFRSFGREKAHAEWACAGAAVGPEVPGIGLVGSGVPGGPLTSPASARQRRGWDLTPRTALRRSSFFKTDPFGRSGTPPFANRSGALG